MLLACSGVVSVATTLPPSQARTASGEGSNPPLLGSTASTHTLEKLLKRPNSVVFDLSIEEIFVLELCPWLLLLDLYQLSPGLSQVPHPSS